MCNLCPEIGPKEDINSPLAQKAWETYVKGVCCQCYKAPTWNYYCGGIDCKLPKWEATCPNTRKTWVKIATMILSNTFLKYSGNPGYKVLDKVRAVWELHVEGSQSESFACSWDELPAQHKKACFDVVQVILENKYTKKKAA